MAKIYHSITELVGHTPLLELQGLEKKYNLSAKILLKLEYYNPNQSVKDRIALSMIEDGEKTGKLKPGDTIYDLTSGNTGIGLAGIGAAKGYPVRLYIQDQVSKERYQVIHAFGAETVKLSEVPEIVESMEKYGPDFVEATKALKRALKDEDDLWYADQTKNPANPDVHFRTTGPEIWEDTDGNVDIFVANVGTGGTLSGAGNFLKSKNPDIQVVAIQPTEDSFQSPERPDQEEITGVHPFENVEERFIPANLDRDVYDDWYEVHTNQAYAAAREAAQSDGILVGASSGAAIHVALDLAKKPENAGKTIVAIAPDTGLRYLSTNMFNEDFPV